MTIILFTLIGILIHSHDRDSREERLTMRLARGYVTGYGVMGIVLTLIHIAGVRLTPVWVWPVAIVIFIVGVLHAKKYINFSRATQKGIAWSRNERVVGLGILILVGWALARAIYWPQTVWWDSYTLYSFKARVFADGRLLTDYFDTYKTVPTGLVYYYSYLPITSLAKAWGLVLSDPLVSWLHPGLYLAILVYVYDLVRRSGTRLMALLATLMVATISTINSLAASEYLTIVSVCYFFVGIREFLVFVQTERTDSLNKGLFYILVSLFVRHMEPYIFLLVPVLIYLARKKRRPIYIFYAGVAAALFPLVQSLHTYFVYRDVTIRYGLSKPMTLSSELHSFDVLKQLLIPSVHLDVMYYSVGQLKTHIPLLLLFGSLMIYVILRKGRALAWGLMVVGMMILIYGGTLVLRIIYPTWNQIDDSYQRNFISVIPLIYVFCALTLTDIWEITHPHHTHKINNQIPPK